MVGVRERGAVVVSALEAGEAHVAGGARAEVRRAAVHVPGDDEVAVIEQAGRLHREMVTFAEAGVDPAPAS